MTLQSTHLAGVLAANSGIDVGYRHAPKQVAPGEALEQAGALLKWYAIYPEDRPIPDDVTHLARAHLETTALEARGMGFVLLHRCGKDFYYLIVCTWRNSNEIWESVFYKDGDGMRDFALFPREGAHKGMLCVWELVPAWHEQQAWVRFLNSTRDEAAAREWLRDRFAGVA